MVVEFICVLLCAHLSFLWMRMNVEMDEIMVSSGRVGVCCLSIGAVVLVVRGGGLWWGRCVLCVYTWQEEKRGM